MDMDDVNESLRCEISLLSDFEAIQDPLGWDVGTHGIEIEFNGPAGSPEAEMLFRGTYLPNVAPEQGWNQLQTLESLTRKAGHIGGFASVADRFTTIRRYQSIKFGMTFTEY